MKGECNFDKTFRMRKTQMIDFDFLFREKKN